MKEREEGRKKAGRNKKGRKKRKKGRKKERKRLGEVAHTLIPALWEAKAGRSPEVRSSRPAWPTW